MYGTLAAKKCAPILHVLDNDSSLALKRIIIKNGANYQLVEPQNCKVKAAEEQLER